MKKNAIILLLVCFCLILAACGRSGAAQADSPAPADGAPAVETTPKPTPTPKPVDLRPYVKELNMIEQEQREKEYPFVGVYELDPEDDRTIDYKLALDGFDLMVLGASLEIEEFVENYNQTLVELPALADSLEQYVHVDAPDAHIKILVMLNKTDETIIAIVQDGQIIYDAVNGIGEEPAPVAPIEEPETTPEATPAA